MTNLAKLGVAIAISRNDMHRAGMAFPRFVKIFTKRFRGNAYLSRVCDVLVNSRPVTRYGSSPGLACGSIRDDMTGTGSGPAGI